MQEKEIINSELLSIIIRRLCHQLIENHEDFENSVIIGVQVRGAYLARRIQSTLKEITGKEVPVGALDITFYRDDFRRRESPLKANQTKVPFLIEGKKVILIDDVLFTGRSVRAAMDAMAAYGRPLTVELLVMIDRKYTRDLPIQADYIGVTVNTQLSQKVVVSLSESEFIDQDSVVLISNHE